MLRRFVSQLRRWDKKLQIFRDNEISVKNKQYTDLNTSKIMKQLTMLKSLLCAVGLMSLGACTQDDPSRASRKPNWELGKDGKAVLSISLPSLEVGIDEEAFRSLAEARAINYELNNKGKMGIQRPALKAGDAINLTLLFNYEGSKEAPLMAKDLPFVWQVDNGKGKLVMKPQTHTQIQLHRKGTNQAIAPHSQEEKDALLSGNKRWYYALIYTPSGATFDGERMTLQSPDVKIYNRQDDNEAPATHDINGTATNGLVDLGDFPFASTWQAFDMQKLLENPHLPPSESHRKYQLPTATGLAPRGYFLMLSFQNNIPDNQSYQINQIKIKTQYITNQGTLLITPPGEQQLNPIQYGANGQSQSEWSYDLLGNKAEVLPYGTKGRYYFFWAMMSNAGTNNPPQIQVIVEGESKQGKGRSSYTFPWYTMPSLQDKATNKGRTLLYTLTEQVQGPEPISENIYHPVDYIHYHNYVRSEQGVRDGHIAEELPENEWQKAQGVSTAAFYHSHSGTGHELRTKSWTPKANAVPNNRRWPSLTDWATVLPLVHSDRTRNIKKHPTYQGGFLEDFVNKWWGLKHPNNGNLTKKVRRSLSDLTKESTPSHKGTENNRNVYEMEGGKEIISFHTSQGSHYTMVLGAEYILHTDNGQPNDVFYGRRFIGSHSLRDLRANGQEVKSEDLNDHNAFPGSTPEAEIAKHFPENRLLSAWRYEREVSGSGATKTMIVKIKFVLLGAKRSSVTLEQIGSESWWQTEERQGNVRELHLRMPRFHTNFGAIPHLTTSYYNTSGVAFFVDENAVWYEDIANFTTNSNTLYYLKLSLDR